MNNQVEQIRSEIERLKAIADYQLDNCKVDKSAWRQQAEVCKKILSFINSMGEDRPEPISPADVGFEALGKVWDEEARKDSDELTHSVTKLSDQDEPVSEDMEAEFLRAAHNLREQPTLSAWFRHFYNLGKQQIIKDAVDGVTKVDNNGNILLEANLNHLAKNCDLSQRVKLVIIKED